MKRVLIQDEFAFPVYFLVLPHFQGTQADVDDELAARYDKVMADFAELQADLANVYKRATS